jgi:hypothetical protein
MDLMLAFKGENGKIEYTRVYSFDDETLTRLKKDFEEDYCTATVPRRGGWYECTWDGKPRVVFIKFDEILYMG